MSTTLALPIFFQKLKCERKLHCKSCRTDRAWRVSISQTYTPPDGKVDWECPLDVPWPEGYEPGAEPTVHAGRPDGYRNPKGPGRLLASLIHTLTGQQPCDACLTMAYQMDEWGWWGCWKNRKLIKEHLLAQCKERGLECSDSLVESAVRQALRGVKLRRGAKAK
jgi:hypothetical protein